MAYSSLSVDRFQHIIVTFVISVWLRKVSFWKKWLSQFLWAAATEPQRPHWKWMGKSSSVVSACHNQDSMQDSVCLIVTVFYTFIHPSWACPDTIVHSYWLRNCTRSELDWMKHLWRERKTNSQNHTWLNTNSIPNYLDSEEQQNCCIIWVCC